ncbi:MAG: cardiolipin synthase, partial [Clostridia bacterium]|nr:cardiolipin synthase [Clostridia bacterium]
PIYYIEHGFFPIPELTGNVAMQVVTSGPDSPIQGIKETFIKMITNAKNEIFIQTPYFVPDESFSTALRIAIASGVKVKIMVPRKPDHRTVYWVTLSYLKELIDLGVEIYLYNGFLHSKTIIVDDNKLSIGTCNLDNRSFGLNFEDTVLFYSKDLTSEYKGYYKEDEAHCLYADKTFFKKKKPLTRFLQAIFRLFSAIF